MRIEKAKLEEIRKATQVWLKRNLDVAVVTEATKPAADNADADMWRTEEDKANEDALTQAKKIVAD